jgi:hypothetical protein
MITIDDQWPDVWSEYRDTFSNLEMNEYEAKAIIVDALDCATVLKIETSAEEIADALKEFCVLLWDRQRTAINIPYRDYLAWAIKGVHGAGSPDKVAEYYFGTRGPKLYAVLATITIDVSPAPAETWDPEFVEWLATRLERIARTLRQHQPTDIELRSKGMGGELREFSMSVTFPAGVDLVSGPPSE